MSTAQETPFGQYQLIEKIAQGGMAEIFKGKALDAEGLERPIVIKRILPHIAASPEFVEMLIDEAKIAVMLNHGNIAQVYDLGKVADDYFIVMEYVDGKTLSQIMKRLRTQGKLMPVVFAAYLAMEIANALDYMHRRTDEEGRPLRIVHRDISPQNAILSTSGTVKIIDFGIAKAKTKISTTDSGVLKGKFAYMSPEHALGMKLDSRTDIFSLGVILFEMLTGQRLFKGKNNFDTVRRVKKAKVPKPSGIRSAVTKDLDAIVLKALAKNREKRYQSAGDLSRDLQKFLIQHYPTFSPRELGPYLHSLFPEINPLDATGQEVTPMVPHEVYPHEQDSPEREDTMAADSALLKQKHEEAEIFSVEGTERTDPSQKERSETGDEEKTSQMKGFLTKKWFVLAASLVIFLFLIWGTIHLFHSRKKKTAPVEDPKKRELLMAIAKKREMLAHSKKSPKPSTKTTPTEKTTRSVVSPATPKPIIKPPVKTLNIDSIPPGAKIFLNDVDTSFVTPHLFEEPPSGPLKIGLFLDKYKFWESEAVFKDNKSLELAIPLTPNYGSLVIESLPSDAQVWINGKESGRTPFRLEDLVPDTAFDIVIKKEGYEMVKETAKIFGGKSEVLKVTLKKMKEPLPE